VCERVVIWEILVAVIKHTWDLGDIETDHDIN
jgi:hypothetical protein